jgi:poly(glycerol-phosphate) alpha-glucosyltransferase
MLIDAWSALAREGKNGLRWRLVVAGWDEIGHEAELKRLVGARSLSATVEFVGPLFGAAKAAALAHAEAFALPSRSEGLPMAVLEAWAYGKPVLMTSACNLPEGAAEGAAIEVEPNPMAVAEGLRRLTSLSDTERAEMGRAGRRLVERRYTWKQIGADMARVYRAVSSRAPLPEDLIFPSAGVSVP